MLFEEGYLIVVTNKVESQFFPLTRGCQLLNQATKVAVKANAYPPWGSHLNSLIKLE